MAHSHRFFAVLLFATALSGCGERRGPPITADATFEFQLGQGSGWHGLDLLKIPADGMAVYEYQPQRGKWFRKRFSVDKGRLEALIEKIKALNILDMERWYTSGIADGTQWCILIKSGGQQKSIYCDNKFPQPIKDLAAFVHETIIEPLGGRVEAVVVPEREHHNHEKEIWASIR
jgi:hypothetical protein